MQVHDNSIPFMPRVEVLDARSGAHLGAVDIIRYQILYIIRLSSCYTQAPTWVRLILLDIIYRILLD